MVGSVPLTETTIPDLKLVRRGKVRDVYTVDDEHLLIVATDRISAFDCILPTPIKDKGRVLTAISRFWFERLNSIVPHHLITTKVEEMPEVVQPYADLIRDRSMFVKRTTVIPIECVVRGYIAGSGWKDYKSTGQICGHRLPSGLQEADRLPNPIFTPATKAETGHDENISEEKAAEIVGLDTIQYLRDISIRLYSDAVDYAATKGIIIADTKFEFGKDRDGKIVLIDEILTPDSSRFWPVSEYSPGKSQPSFDKQFVRDYLETLPWDKRPPAPPLPEKVAEATTKRYLQAYQILTGNELISN
jgi:phosphoribosylaminoimidazole-succinocarboxamide synthase